MRRLLLTSTCSALALLLASAVPTRGAAAAAQPAPLAVGSPAPPFALMGSDGRIHKLADSLGKQVVVLAWFAKAFSAG